MPFHKMEGVGNDFVLIEADAASGRDLSELAQRLCHRPFGIGADGLLVVERGVRTPVRMRMFNPDGTEDFCGNGLRCAARFAYEQGYASATEFAIETLGGQVVPVQIHLREGSVDAITTVLPPPRFHPHDIPALAEGELIEDFPITVAGHPLRIACVNTGTTHTVIFGATLPDDALFHAVSPRLETHPMFPERTSVLWAVVASRKEIRVRIWERGVGETLGCGSGAAAVGVLAYRAGWTEPEVTVVSAGGRLKVKPTEDGIALVGQANTLFKGVFYF
ncbi:MAG: diaminopimelate epimerase [Armatimonadetes bacterium JP3_11]|nr:MAG: diaminopimelate epimerase [Armatimonadetes bacterium JP3_11]RMH06310.1 MAG: diaminopimelate epimerase [Armatimonadota bacterium]